MVVREEMGVLVWDRRVRETRISSMILGACVGAWGVWVKVLVVEAWRGMREAGWSVWSKVARGEVGEERF